jgi:hypothetical protein
MWGLSAGGSNWLLIDARDEVRLKLECYARRIIGM